MKTITATVAAWIPDFRDDALDGTAERVVSQVAYSSNNMTTAGWTRIGEADITIRIVDEDALVQGQIASLEKQRAAVLADAQQKCNYINDRISKLQALTYEAAR